MDTGYECHKCGYEPTQKELDNGSCPGCKPVSLRETPKPLGHHLLIELYGCNPLCIDSLEIVSQVLQGIAKEVKATVLGETFHKFEPQGVTGILLLAESHFSIHTWPEKQYAAIDFFTCGDPVPVRRVPGMARTSFEATKMDLREMDRGQDHEKFAHRHPLTFRMASPSV
jgi:S-adenosylmethionine decarboxylase